MTAPALRALSANGLLAFGFANPWLLCGLALGAIPIVIDLLSRRAYRETDWAAMRFPARGGPQNLRRMRLEQLILLAVRTLILLLAALAFVQPLVEAVSPQARPRTLLHRVIVIDASFSMGQRRTRAHGSTVRKASRADRGRLAGRRRDQRAENRQPHSARRDSRAGLRSGDRAT